MIDSSAPASFIKRIACVLLSLSLVLLLLPCTTPVSDTAYADTLPGNYVDGELLVVYRSGTAQNDDGIVAFSDEPSPLEAAGLSVDETWTMGGATTQEDTIATLCLDDSSDTAPATESSADDVVVSLVRSSDKTTTQLKQQVDALDCTVATSPNYLVTPASVPDDTFYKDQYNLNDSTGGINYETALDKDALAGTSAEDNIVAVIDTGVDYTHPDLKDNMWVNPGNIGLEGAHGYDFGDRDDDPAPTSSMHGTHCAGIIAAQTNNAEGVAGTAQHTKIMALKQDRGVDNSSMSFSSIVASYNYISKAISAGQNVVGINNSYGLDLYCPVLDYCVNQVGKQGALSIFAAGNSGEDVKDSAAFGATVQLESPYAVMVAANNSLNQLASYSNINETMVDIAAPGSRIISTIPTNDSHARASQEYSAGLAAATGKDTIVHYDGDDVLDDGGDLLNGFKWGVFLNGVKASDADKACFGMTKETYNGRPALKVSVDVANLSDPTLTNYVFNIDCKTKNPFAGVTDDVSKLRAGVDVFMDTQDVSYCETSSMAAALTVSSAGSDRTVYVRSIASDSPDFHSYQSTTPLLANSSSDEMWISVSIQAGGTAGNTLSYYVTDISFAYASENADYGYASGTSMACPQVVGALAELASLYPKESALDLRGRLVGGTVKMEDSIRNTGHTATDGRFDFAVATDDAALNANSYGVVTNGNQITVRGYALDHATLSVDGTAITPSAQTSNEITFAADNSLFDGAKHTFNLTDTASGRTHKASYVVPLGTDSKNPDTGLQSALERVGNLPVSDDVASRGCLVSSADTLFFADNAGEYLYSTADPTGSWTKLSTPTLDSHEASGSPFIAYQYLNNKLHAFYVDYGNFADEKAKPKIYHAAYDIAADSWGLFEMVAEVSSGSSNFSMDYLSTTAQDNTVYCAYSQEQKDTKTSSEPFYTGFTWLVTGADNGAQFTSAKLEYNNSQLGAVFGLNVVEGDVHGAALDEQANMVHDTTIDGGITTDNGVFSNCNLGREELRAMDHQVTAQTGAGLLSMGRSYDGMGDTYLFNSATKTWDSIGTLLGTAGDATTPSSAVLFGGAMYVNAVDAPGLYSFPENAAAKVVDIDCTLKAQATEGGSAAVADARNTPAATLVARSGDQATWTATVQDGYRFVGWLDAAGTLVSETPTLTVSSVADETYTASFEPVESGGGTPEPSTDTPDSADKADPAKTKTASAVAATKSAATGDCAFAPCVALAVMAAGVIVLAGISHKQRKR